MGTRTEVQAILDKDWPNNTSGRYTRYGSHLKSVALVRVAMHAEDCGDSELYQQAVECAELILDDNPEIEREFEQVIFPQYHTMMHAEDQKLITFKEKHGDWFFISYGATEFSMVMLTVLEQRLEEGWYLNELYGDDVPDDDVDPNQMKLFGSNKIPKTDRENAQAIVDLARSDKPGCVIKAGKAAYDFLNNRDNSQYEEMSIDYPSTAKFSLTPGE